VVSERVHDVGLASAQRQRLHELPETYRQGHPDWVFLDTETTGLSGGTGNLAFMVGVARYRSDHRLLVRQYTMGAFGAERAMLADLLEWIGDEAVLVSYNGRGFDLPLLVARLRLHRLPHGLDRLPHLDLMVTVRRAYRQRWPDCRLQTAERRRLALQRVDDLPGALAPQAWRQWLQSGGAAGLAEVVRHNAQDVVSLARLQAALVADYVGASHHDIDLLRVGRAWESAGCAERAIALWSTARRGVDEAVRLALAAAYRRQGRWGEAESVWMELYRRGNRDAALALSKYHEHRHRDFGLALRFAEACDDIAEVRRRQRLRRKLAKARSGHNLELPLDAAMGQCDVAAVSPNATK